MIPQPRCKQGQMAWIIKSLMPENIGKQVSIVGYIGYFEAEQSFEYNGMTIRVPVTSHYWWVTCPSGLSTPVGETSKGVGPDIWLQPIDPDLLSDDEETGDEVYNTLPENIA